MEYNKNILTIFVLSVITVILLTMIVSNKITQDSTTEINNYYQGVIDKLLVENEAYKREMQASINELKLNLTEEQTPQTPIIITPQNNQTESNAELITIVNKFLENNEEQYIDWLNKTQTAIDKAYQDGRDSKRGGGTRIIYVEVPTY